MKLIERNIIMNNKRNVTFGDLAEQVMVRISPTSDDAKHFIGLEHLKSGYFYVHDWGLTLN